MRGEVTLRLRRALGILVACAAGSVFILVANVLITGLILFALHVTGVDDMGPSAEKVSTGLSERDGSYVLSHDMTQALRDRGYWAMLIDETGHVIWSLDLPGDVPVSYTSAEIASFARWYLNDYPVTCWQHNGDLVVIGSPKGSVWKYPLSSLRASLVGDALLVFAIFLVDLVILIILARSFARRSWKQRDDARNEWIAAVSHDVRTPLSIVVTDASNLETSPRLNEEEHARVERMVSKSQEMAALLADLNTANRLRYAMEPVDAQHVHMAAVVRRAIADHLDDAADTYGLELEVTPAAEDACVRGNEALLRRMVSNLIGNSIRHNPQGCYVQVSLGMREGLLGTACGRRCVLTVRDDGRGFGAETLTKLREKLGDDLPEHGLGLVIVRRIAAAHGGQATFENGGIAAEKGQTRFGNERPILEHEKHQGCVCTVTLPVVARRSAHNMREDNADNNSSFLDS